MKNIIILIAVLLFTGCQTAGFKRSNLAMLTPGMSKQEIISVLGAPDDYPLSFQENGVYIEILEYKERDFMGYELDTYYLVFADNKFVRHQKESTMGYHDESTVNLNIKRLD